MNPAQSKRRTRTLIFENKLYKTNLFGESVEVTTGSVDEKRSTTKQRIFEDSNAALSWTIDQERKKLRQGFTIDNPGALAAEPLLAMRVTSSYTGLLPVATYSYGLLTAFTDSSQKDIVIDIDGTEAYEVVQIDTGIVSKIMEFDDNIYLLVNHQVMKVHADGSIVQLTNMGEHPISALEIAAGRAAWLDKGELVLSDLKSGKVLWSQSLQPIKQNGHTTQFVAALSDRYLVYCDQPKKVVVYDLITKLKKHLS